MPSGGYVVIAINADNPGYWYLHCHIERHTEGGMIALLQEYPADQHKAPPPGINNDGDFVWSVQKYMDFLRFGETCADANDTMITLTRSSSDDDITISRVGFGFSLLILILFAIASVILIVVVIILSIKVKEKGIPPKKLISKE
jgi:hypothetical protein